MSQVTIGHIVVAQGSVFARTLNPAIVVVKRVCGSFAINRPAGSLQHIQMYILQTVGSGDAD